MSNLDLWNKVSRPPKEALKMITGGRLNGMTDVNPQWRIKAMTEQFGQCGVGWKYEIFKQWTERFDDGQIAAFALVFLYTKHADEWSEPVHGIGGSMLVAQEVRGLRVNDEAYKMAVTDALSVAMKALGVAADIYAGLWDGTKYKDTTVNQVCPEPVDQAKVNTACAFIKEKIDEDNWDNHLIIKKAYNKLSNDERIALNDALGDKAKDSNRMYRTLLKDYLNYQPEEQANVG